MKKYKLKQWYPGCGIHKVGDIVVEYKAIETRYQGRPREVDSPITYTFDQKEVEDNPIYWEKVIEKDYEILTYRNNSILTEFKSYKDYMSLVNHSKQFWHIYSVKRKSDGEIFTIDDRTESVGIIKSFEITPCNNLCVNGKKICDDIEYVKHFKKPLFTTEDGVDIFEGDCNRNGNGKRLYQVPFIEGEDSWNDPYKPYSLLILNDHYLRKFPKESLIFSTEKAAQEYISKNNPCLSLKDVQTIYDRMGERTKKKFELLIKSKTNEKS